MSLNVFDNFGISLPGDCSKQWEIILLIIANEEKKSGRKDKGEVEAIKYYYNHQTYKQLLLQWINQMITTYGKTSSETDTPLKCNEVALHWRQKGNVNFRQNLVEESYKCYSSSVAFAPQDGPMFPLALANRSAALLRMKHYKECLTDIGLALGSGYPRELRHKLYLRRADCHVELQQRQKAKEALRTAASHAESLKLDEACAAEFAKHIKAVEQKLNSLPAEEPPEEEDELPDCFEGSNPNFNAASNALVLKKNDTVGRHVIAASPLERGAVLFSEEPYAWVTLHSDLSVCDTCCEAGTNTLPCSVCSRAKYCSEGCLARGWLAFHRWECVGARANIFPTIGIAHLALRVLLLTAFDGFPKVPAKELDQQTAKKLYKHYGLIDNVKIYKQGTPAFYRMFNLVTNFDKMSSLDYGQYALTATMLLLYLENHTKFFDYLPGKMPHPLPQEQLKLFCGALILRSIGQLVANGHAALTLATVMEHGNDKMITMAEREVRRATAIYPSAAMLNHSCDPNIVHMFHKNKIIIKCARTVSRGGEVLNCYGPHRAREPLEMRRDQLRAQYAFHCLCTACRCTDPVEFVSLFNAFVCLECRGPAMWEDRRLVCKQCHAELDSVRTMELLALAESSLAEMDSGSKIQLGHMALSIQQQLWHRHNSSLRATADKVARMLAETGEFSKSIELVKQNIQSLEYRFGPFSGEVGHELRKLADIMMERLVHSESGPDYSEWCLETLKITKKARQVMDFNYGHWEPLVKRLKEQEDHMAGMVAANGNLAPSDSVHHSLHYNLKI